MRYLSSITFAIGICLHAGALFAQASESQQEARALDLVKAIQTGDADSVLAFMHQNWVPDDSGRDREARWRRFAGEVTARHARTEIEGVTIERPDEVIITTRDPDGMVLSFIFAFESKPPYRIASLGLEAGREPAGGDLPAIEWPEGAPDADLVNALEVWFDSLAMQDLFSGTVLVAVKGAPVFEGAWGLASKRFDIPNRVDTRFDLGSINKSFTKIAIGQLWFEGKLSLDDVIAAHLPDYPNSEVAQRVTIRQLLDHTAGLGDIFTEDFFNSAKSQYRSPRDFFWLFADREPEFEPGTKRSYSNAGFMVLGAIIEAVSGQAYDAYIREHIFQPAGMAGAGFFAHDEPVANVAEGYTHMGPGTDENGWRSNVLMMPAKGNSAGSAQANVRDLLHFDNALRDFELLPREYTQWYFGGEEPASGATSEPGEKRATATLGIAGGAPGVSACLESDADLAVIVLSNYDAPITEQVARALFRPLKRAFAIDR